jgi:hypothetical protein
MEALRDKGYDVNYTWSIGKHGARQGGPLLPEMMAGSGAIRRSRPTRKI